MPRGPEKPRAVFADYAGDVQRVFGDELEGIIAFGDVVTGDYVPGRSPIEFLVSVADARFGRIKCLASVVARWHRQRIATPLVVSSGYVQSSLDSYPLEFLNMSLYHELVSGRDVLDGLAFDREQLRVQCEREAKTKVQQIKRSYLDTEGELKQIASLMAGSIDHYVAILRALIHLRDKPAPGPRLKVFKAAGKILNLSEGVFVKVLRLREEEARETKATIERLFEDYVGQLEEVAEIADRL